MIAAAFSPRLTRMLEILGACVLFFMVASGLFRQFMGWELDGSDLANYGDPLQLLFNLGPTPVKGFVNPLSQVHQCFNGHP